MTHDYFKERTWNNNDLVVDDLVVTTFDYNSMSPRLYSKYFVDIDPGNYNFKIYEAASASASAPVAFSPLIR